MKTDDTSQLKILGSGKTSYQFDQPTADMLETFPNNFPERDYVIRFACPEFTSLCPMTGQPDFAEFVIDYVPDQRCIESKKASSTSSPSATTARSWRPSPTPS